MNLGRNLLSILIVFWIGIIIGIIASFYIGMPSKTAGQTTIERIFSLIEKDYVDTLDSKLLSRKVISTLMEQLDPHSLYIPPEELQAVQEDIQGNFEGIGINFRLFQDTILVISTIQGGPSFKEGVLAGDRIVAIDDSNAIGLSQNEVISKLKGRAGSKVKLTIFRRQKGSFLTTVIERGKIDLKSVETAFMISDSIGYIKLNRFSATTHSEFVISTERLKKQGALSLILDLRGNPGGILDEAVKILDEFIDGRQNLVSTIGKNNSFSEKYWSKPGGRFINKPLVILIDKNSASASEIIAGVVQDLEVGTVIGETSFGKGLVQKQYYLPEDSGAIRLTISRYYIPSGRSIQRSFKYGKEDYYNSIYFDQKFPDTTVLPKYKTINGNLVYGGMGIIPDEFVPEDSVIIQQVGFLNRIGINDLVQSYVDENREQLLNKFKTVFDFVKIFEVDHVLKKNYYRLVKEGENNSDLNLESMENEYTWHFIKANIARLLYGDLGYHLQLSTFDPVMLIAIKKLNKF